jgi:hypothetical protein
MAAGAWGHPDRKAENMTSLQDVEAVDGSGGRGVMALDQKKQGGETLGGMA